MEQLTKAFLGVTLMIFLAFIGIGIITASADSAHAEDYATKIASVIEASNYSESVINSCKEKVKEAGYKNLTVNTYDLDNDGHNDMAEVVIEYTYTISALNITGNTHYAKAFAR